MLDYIKARLKEQSTLNGLGVIACLLGAALYPPAAPVLLKAAGLFGGTAILLPEKK